LMAQIYAVCWQVLSTASLAYWPIFVKRRNAAEATVRMWWRLTGIFGAAGAAGLLCLTLLGPWAAAMLSGGQIDVSTTLALGFGFLLLVQVMHLPTLVLLTTPDEARWQALWAVAMAAVSIGRGLFVAPRYGAVGVVYTSAVAIVVAQVLPDLVWVPRLVRRRSPVAAEEVSPLAQQR
jgi:hypothetical protein